MPVDRTVAEGIGTNLVDLYAAAEAQLMAEIGRRLAAGLDAPDWAERKLAAIGSLRSYTQRLLAGLGRPTQAEASAAILQATTRGQQAARAELERLAVGNYRLRKILDAGRAATTAGMDVPGAGPAGRLAGALADRLLNAHTPVLRWALDAYREVIGAGAAPSVILGLTTRRRASERAWNDLLDQGVTGFVDRANRRWSLASYVEMATRTSVAQAAVEAHADQLASAGIDLVIVSNAPQECERCRPWEGKVLSRGGPSGRHEVQLEHATRDGEMVTVEVAGSLDEATSKGLLHPNCRHSLGAYLPGVTKTPTHTADPQGDADRQELRRLEREVRRAKLRQAGALTPEARAAAGGRVRDLQGQIRNHVDSTGLHRQPGRERIDLGNQRIAGQPTPPKPKPAPKPQPTPLQRIESGDLSGLRRVGPQGGSNPGGLYEAADGSRWYVKTAQSADHASNEKVSAELYRAAGIDVPDIHIGKGAPDLPDGPQLASRIVQDATQDLGSRLNASGDPAVQKLRDGFAVDAWLGNWDVAGATYDNVVFSGGKPWRIDVGGSLKYRAQGSPKGAAFGDKVTEWDTLRDTTKARQSSRVFGPMSPAERIASAKRVEGVSEAKIRAIVKAAGLDDDLAKKLIARRADVLRRAIEDANPFEILSAADADAMQDAMFRAAGAWTEPQRRGLRHYTGGAYTAMNSWLRGLRGHPGAIDAEAIKDAMAGMRPVTRNVRVARGINDLAMFGATSVDDLRRLVRDGTIVQDKGFVSTSINTGTAFGGSYRLIVDVPAGAPGAYVARISNFPREQELLLPPGTKFVLTDIDDSTRPVTIRLRVVT